MPSKANYSVIEDCNEHVILSDVGPWSNFPTITNDADAVVKEWVLRLNGRRLYYFDSDNEIAELLIRDNKFAGFGFGGPYDNK